MEEKFVLTEGISDRMSAELALTEGISDRMSTEFALTGTELP